MRVPAFLLAFLTLLVTTVLAWEKEDHEIFDLVSELEAAEGKGTTFYSWLDVPSTASTNEIAKAYRKKSMLLHPDKNPDIPGIHERFARLGVISTILRKKESRERYDFFYKNGVPKWRGTGYYYSRYRPGVGFVLVFLTILTSGLQYIVQRFNYKKDLARIEVIVGKAKAAAWGPKMVPANGQRKVRINLGDSYEDGYSAGAKFLDMVVDEQHVYLLEPSGDMHLIDASTATPASISNTWFITLVKSLYHKVAGAKSTDTPASTDPVESEKLITSAPDIDSDDASSTNGSEATRSGTSTPRRGDDAGKRVPTSKAGGMRRKNLKRK